MPDSSRTEGEKLFELYLESQNLPFTFEAEHVGKLKRPDYSLEWNGQPVIVDIKDFASPQEFRVGLRQVDPYPPIREKIEQGRDKFKQFKDVCCALVLCNLGNPFVMLEQPDIVLGAMYGDSGFTFPVNLNTGVGDATKLKQAFLNRGKMVRPHWSKPQNTTIAALITLTKVQPHYELMKEALRNAEGISVEQCLAALESMVPGFDLSFSVPRVIVWHNGFARVPFPVDLFCGHYDVHFGVVKDEEGTYQRETFRGSKLPLPDKRRNITPDSP
jgi:hypothetical protein